MDTLEEQLRQNNYSVLREILLDIQQRLCQLTPNRPDLQDNIYEFLDVDFILQMVQNNAFNAQDAQALITFVISRIKALQSPAYDTETLQWEQDTMIRVCEEPPSTFFPTFLLDVQAKLQRIKEEADHFFKKLGLR